MSLYRFIFKLVACACFMFHVSSAKAQQETPPWPANNADSIYYEAVEARMLGDDKKSETLLKRVVVAKPDESAPYYDLSRLALKANDAEKATE